MVAQIGCVALAHENTRRTDISEAVSVISDMNLQIASAAEQATESAKISSQLNNLANHQMKLMDQFKV